MRNIGKFKIIYEYIGDKGTPEQKKESERRLAGAFEIIFRKLENELQKEGK